MIVCSSCPDPQDIEAHSRGKLDSKFATRLELHLAACRDCLGQLVQLGQREALPAVKAYHLISELGRGRFGVVYKAWWLSRTPTLVALKLLSFKGDMERNRFEREIKVLRQIDSPYVVKCLDAGWAGDTPYHAMQLVEGVHLDEYLANTTETLEEKLVVFERVCRAVADAHAKNVTHRDLKPKNILVDGAGEPHVLDFGICGVESDGWGSSTRSDFTQVGDIIGTLRYMSPEQAWGGCCGSIGKHSDLWSLGIMLHEIVTDGGYPYDIGSTPGKSAQEALIERIRKELPRIPSLSHLERGKDLETLLSRCLTWEPECRLNSAAHFADDIQRYREGSRIQTKPPSLRFRLKRMAVAMATHARWAALVAVVALVGVALWTLPLLCDVRWRVAGHSYAQANTSLTGALATQRDPRDRILVVGVFDETVDEVIRYAWDQHLPGVTSRITTWRAVHGGLMERLVAAQPAVVVWDYFFRSPQPGDGAFVAGLEALEASGVPVVLASRSYRADGSPDISPNIASALGDRLRHGAIFARDMVERKGEFVLALRGDSSAVVPSIAMTTLAAILHPTCVLELEWNGHDRNVGLFYRTSAGDYRRERDAMALTKVTKLPEGGSVAGTEGTQGIGAFPLARPSEWKERTVSYSKLLHASSDELQALARDRVVLVGDFRRKMVFPRADVHNVRFGPGDVVGVPGVYLLADSVSGLLAGRYYKAAVPVRQSTFSLMMLFAVVGTLVPIGLTNTRLFEHRWQQRVLYGLVVALLATSGWAFLGTESFVAVHLGMAGVALLVPLLGSFWIERTRNRHRVADRELQAVRGFQMDSGGTVTMPRRASTSMRAMPTPR